MTNTASSTADGTGLTIYSTTWCPFSRRLLADLDAADVDYRNVDVDDDVEAGELVKSLNDGNRTVPTVVFADGTSMTNPTIREVQSKLGSADPPAELADRPAERDQIATPRDR